MFRSRGENLRSTYVLLFLNVAFFLLQYQDAEKFARLFGFERGAVAAGQVWRALHLPVHAGRAHQQLEHPAGVRSLSEPHPADADGDVDRGGVGNVALRRASTCSRPW